MKNKPEELAKNNHSIKADIACGTFKIVPPPMTIRISDPITNEILGEFKEKDGLLTFEGKVDDAGKVFVNFICETFKKRIEHLYCHYHVSGSLLSDVDYWKQRCLLAEQCLKESPCDPDINADQIKAWNAYHKFISWAGNEC